MLFRILPKSCKSKWEKTKKTNLYCSPEYSYKGPSAALLRWALRGSFFFHPMNGYQYLYPMAPHLLQARWILPVDAPPIEGGVVSIADGLITSVGPSKSAGSTPHDLGDVVLMPGLVNAHTHLEFSNLEKPLGRPGMPLPGWIRLAIADRRRADRDELQAINSGLEESLRHGVTTIGEIATAPLELYLKNENQLAIILFSEVIGFSASRTNSAFATVEKTISPAGPQRGPRHGPRHGPRRGPRCPIEISPTYGISPHAPYTVHPRLLHQLIDLATNCNLPVAMHLAESSEELQLLARGDGPFQELLEERSMWDPTAIAAGLRPLDYLEQLARAPRSLVIHGNYLDGEEIDFLARHRNRMAVVYCPRTHGYFGHVQYPLGAMLAAGVQVALGTDSRASNSDLSLLEEMREIARKHPKITTEQIVRLGTIEGATALGRENAVGSIAPGKRADLTVIPCRSDCDDPYDAVVYGQDAPVGTWVLGERLIG